MSNITSFSDRQQARQMAQDLENQDYYPSRSKYASSTYSTSTTATERPLLTASEKSSSSSSRKSSSPKKTSSSSSSDKKEKKSSRAWEKTKKVLSTIGEPPTLEYDRQQALRDTKDGKRDLDHKQPGMGLGPFNDPAGGRPFGGLT